METTRLIRFGVDCPLIRSAVVFRDPGHMLGLRSEIGIMLILT
jgi:hypothetical protein